MRRNLGITVSALILSVQLGTPLAAAEPTLDQLSAIAGYLSDNNVRGLRTYLTENPDLLDEPSTLAGLLRDFMKQSENMNAFLGFQPGLRGAFSNFGHGSDDGNSNSNSTSNAATPSAPY